MRNNNQGFPEMAEFEFIKKIGEGGYGNVYSAYEADAEDPVNPPSNP
jgi:serine/threonine protein kinase